MHRNTTARPTTAALLTHGGTPPPDRFPHVDSDQAAHMWPDGVPDSWHRLITEPTTPWWAKAGAVLVSLAAGLATLVSATVAGGAAAVFAGAGEALTVAGHVASFGPFGLVGRLVGALALLAAVSRLGWRLSKWGAAPIGRPRVLRVHVLDRDGGDL